jgi:polyadenylation factor subunit 2
MIGHANDIICCQWHPHLGLIVSGSKDRSMKLWDPNAGEEIANLYL